MKAMIYYRMSSDQQTDSIERQKAEVEPVVKREGDEVVAVFTDRGKSGSKHRSKRTDFLRMMKYIENGCEAKKLYLWDLARFTRENPFKAAEFYGLLMDKGIVIHDCKGGVFDLSTATGRMIVNMLQEMNHRYSTDLSANTTSGRRQLLKAGWWVAGGVPYGFMRRYVGPNGDEVLRPRNDSGFKKPRGWHLALAIHDEEAEVVRAIFRMYLEHDTSLRAIARWLNENGIVPPAGDETKGWKNATVTNIVANRAYCGYSHIGGGHRRYRDAEVFGRVGDNEVKSDKVPEIVSEAEWEKANEKRRSRRERGINPRPTQNGKLSGVLYCAHCRYALDKVQRSNRKRDPYVYYTCQSGAQYPSKLACHQWRVLEEDMVPLILERLFAGVETKIREMEIHQESGPLDDGKAKRLRKRLKEVEKAISRANRRFLTAAGLSDQMEADLRKILDDYQQEKEQLELCIRSSETDAETCEMIRDGLTARKSMVCLGFTEADEIVVSPLNASGKGSITVRFRERKPSSKTLFDVPLSGEDGLRAFLKDLGTKVYVRWQPRALQDKQGKPRLDKNGQIVRSERNFEVSEIQIKSDFRPEQVLSMGSNTHTRADSRGRD